MKASLRSRHTSIVARPYSKNTRRASRAASGPGTSNAWRKFSAIPRRVRFKAAIAMEFPTVEIVFRTGSGSQRAP